MIANIAKSFFSESKIELRAQCTIPHIPHLTMALKPPSTSVLECACQKVVMEMANSTETFLCLSQYPYQHHSFFAMLLLPKPLRWIFHPIFYDHPKQITYYHPTPKPWQLCPRRITNRFPFMSTKTGFNLNLPPQKLTEKSNIQWIQE